MNTPGITFGCLLALLFITLKLLNQINWAWLWVLSPIWIPLAAVLIISVVTLLASGISSAFSKKNAGDK